MDPRTAKMLEERAQAAQAIPKPLRGITRFSANARHWIKRNRLHAIALSVVAIVVLGVGYYSMVVVPAAERDRVELANRSAERLKTETISKHSNIEACLEKAKTDAAAEWVAACKAKREKPGCALPRNVVQEQQQRENQARNACLVTN